VGEFISQQAEQNAKKQSSNIARNIKPSTNTHHATTKNATGILFIYTEQS
jgi:hypothetical protein